MASMIEMARAFEVAVVGVPWLAGGVEAAWVPEHRVVMVLETVTGPSRDDLVAQALEDATIGPARR